jgi:hypothetical protein
MSTESRRHELPRVSGSGRAGVAAVVGVALANIVLWLLARPDGQPAGRFFGELLGAEAVLLFSLSLVLATLPPRSSGPSAGSTGWRGGIAMPRSAASCC